MIKIIVFLGLLLFGTLEAQTLPSGFNISLMSGSDVTNNTTSLSDITGLSFPVVSGTYYFEFSITYTTAATTTGSKFAINSSAGLVSLAANTTNTSTGGGGVTATNFNTFNDGVTSANSISGNNYCFIYGIITVNSSGTLIARVASEVGASDVTVKGGNYSFVKYIKIN